MSRNVYVYRLDIIYPEMSPGLLDRWREVCDELGWADEHGSTRPFEWPPERRFLSQSAAKHRKGILERLGATVTVVRSLPVEWPASALAGSTQ